MIAEARAVRNHGDLVSIWPEHRLYAVQSAVDALGRAGIPSLARSAHQRALWHFFAPFVPVQIMVPRSRSEEAGALLHQHFLQPAAVATRRGGTDLRYAGRLRAALVPLLLAAASEALAQPASARRKP